MGSPVCHLQAFSSEPDGFNGDMLPATLLASALLKPIFFAIEACKRMNTLGAYNHKAAWGQTNAATCWFVAV